MQKNYRLNPLIVPAIVAAGLTTEKLLPTALLVHSYAAAFTIKSYNVHIYTTNTYSTKEVELWHVKMCQNVVILSYDPIVVTS